MPGRSRKISWQGRTVDATEVTYQPSGEHWNEYLVDDGTVIKMKTVVTEILRVQGEHDQEGNPVYLVKSANIMAVNAPENLRRGGG